MCAAEIKCKWLACLCHSRGAGSTGRLHLGTGCLVSTWLSSPGREGWHEAGQPLRGQHPCTHARAHAHTHAPTHACMQTILEEAYTKTTARGSCTACIAVLLPPSSSSPDAGASAGSARLRVCNLGDSGALVLRAGKVVFHSPQQQHGFNFPFQVRACTHGGERASERGRASAVWTALLKLPTLCACARAAPATGAFSSEQGATRQAASTCQHDGGAGVALAGCCVPPGAGASQRRAVLCCACRSAARTA